MTLKNCQFPSQDKKNFVAETAVDFTFAEVQIVKHLTESGPGSFFPSFPILKVLTQTMLGISSILKEPLGISYLE